MVDRVETSKVIVPFTEYLMELEIMLAMICLILSRSCLTMILFVVAGLKIEYRF